MYGMMLSNLLMLPFFIYLSIKTTNLTLNISYLKESLKFSIPMIPALLSALILNISDRVFMERYYSFHDVGIYSLGYKIGMIVVIFSGAFFQAYLPTFYRLANSEKQVESKKQLFNNNRIYVLIIIVIGFLVSFFSKELIVLFMDTRFLDAYKIIPIIALSYIISQVSGLFNLMIYQSKKSVMMMIIVIVSAVLNTLLNYLLIPPFGAYGAAWATFLSFIIVFLLSWWYARRCYYIPLAWKTIMIILLPLLIIILIFQYFLDLNIYISLGIKLFICGVIGIVVFKKYFNRIKSIFLKSEV